MTERDTMLSRAPKAFYVLAGLFFAWSIANGYWEFHLNNISFDDAEPIVALMKSKFLFEAAHEASYLVANGVVIQILLNIYNKVKVA